MRDLPSTAHKSWASVGRTPTHSPGSVNVGPSPVATWCRHKEITVQVYFSAICDCDHLTSSSRTQVKGTGGNVRRFLRGSGDTSDDAVAVPARPLRLAILRPNGHGTLLHCDMKMEGDSTADKHPFGGRSWYKNLIAGVIAWGRLWCRNRADCSTACVND